MVWVFQNGDPGRALGALRRSLAVTRDSGNRANESHVAANLCLVEAKHGDPLSALDFFALAIRGYHDSGNTGMIHAPLGGLAWFFDRLGRHEPGFAAVNPLGALVFPEIATAIAHLHEVLGDPVYESLAHDGETMTTAEMATYVYDQIDQARTELKTVSK